MHQQDLPESEIAMGIFTCPMHPEIRQPGPGICPLCGMALERKTVSLEGDNSEYKGMKFRFWLALVLTIPVFVLEMSGHIFFSLQINRHGFNLYLQLLLFLGVGYSF